jgi:hypothetical protein
LFAALSGAEAVALPLDMLERAEQICVSGFASRLREAKRWRSSGDPGFTGTTPCEVLVDEGRCVRPCPGEWQPCIEISCVAWRNQREDETWRDDFVFALPVLLRVMFEDRSGVGLTRVSVDLMTIRKCAFFAAWTGLALIVLVTVSPIDLRPPDLTSTDLDRALAFFVMSCLFVIAYPQRVAKVSIALVMSAFAIELTQFLSVTRHPELHDALIKAAGVALGIGAGLLVNFLLDTRESAARAAG